MAILQLFVYGSRLPTLLGCMGYLGGKGIV